MDKKYLVIEHHKFKTFNDDWTIKYANVDEDTAFTKMVALRTLNEDTNKIYYVVDMEYLWTKDKLNDNEVKEDKQQMLF